MNGTPAPTAPNWALAPCVQETSVPLPLGAVFQFAVEVSQAPPMLVMPGAELSSKYSVAARATWPRKLINAAAPAIDSAAAEIARCAALFRISRFPISRFIPASKSDNREHVSVTALAMELPDACGGTLTRTYERRRRSEP